MKWFSKYNNVIAVNTGRRYVKSDELLRENRPTILPGGFCWKFVKENRKITCRFVAVSYGAEGAQLEAVVSCRQETT
jgi:hypothetical protein